MQDKTRKMRMTRQRKVILEELKKVTSHPTADQVYQMVKVRLPKISLATVYRNLEALSEAGLILKLELGGIQRRYDGDTSPHHHVRCIACNAVADLPEEALDVGAIDFKSPPDFEICGFRLEFLGVCSHCRGRTGCKQART
ncbi:MAG: transcriptional repressor [Deltaproteobacteria bacterium]|nr:transcriptional repressor [Deltaproteobacteria bacterium]